MTMNNELIDELIKDCKTQEDLFGYNNCKRIASVEVNKIIG